MIRTLTVAAMLMIPILANADQKDQVMGTVKAISSTALTLHTIDKPPRIVSLVITPSTQFIKDGKRVSISDLKTGTPAVITTRCEADGVKALKVVFGALFEHLNMHEK